LRNSAYCAANYQEAIKLCDKAIKIKPDYANAYNNRGNAYAALGDHKNAIDSYDRAINTI
jgi:tetratricopeptide (TPR) repeat protein